MCVYIGKRTTWGDSNQQFRASLSPRIDIQDGAHQPSFTHEGLQKDDDLAFFEKCHLDNDGCGFLPHDPISTIWHP